MSKKLEKYNHEEFEEDEVESGKTASQSENINFFEILAALLATYDLIVASRLPTIFGIFIPAAQHRAINLAVIVILIFGWFSIKSEKRSVGKIAWYDLIPMLMGLIGAGYAAIFYESVLDYAAYGYLDTKGVILCILLAVPLLEMVRRISGWILPGIIVAILLMTVFQNYLPGALYGNGYDLDRLGYALYAGGSGIFGLPLGVASTILIVYIIFARLLQMTGGGQWFMDLALSLTGRYQGGPAKASVVASGFFGMITGQPSSNVATTGSFTIPLMKDIGYPARFAGAVEAVASTGGQIMPPVMGSTAFVMAEWLAIPYSQIVIAAFIPALLYYGILFMSIHYESKRLNLSTVSNTKIPEFGKTFKQGWIYVAPLATLLYLLVFQGFAPEMAAIFSLIILIFFSFFSKNKEHHLTPRKIWGAFAPAVKTWIVIGVITAGVGMFIGALELSGLGVRFSRYFVDLSGGNLLIALMLVGLASFILGMGMSSVPAYITLASVAAPALIQMGVSPMSAHLYVIYWGLASYITPPVCLAVFVACGISGSKIWETGLEAIRLGIAIFLVPFAFIYNSNLLLIGSPVEVIISVITAFFGASLVAAALRGCSLRGNTIPMFQRVIAFIGGLLFIAPGYLPIIIGSFLAAVSLIDFQKKSKLQKNAI